MIASFIMLVLQVLATIFLTVVVRYAMRAMKIKINIHNIPLILMAALLFSVVMWMSIVHLLTYMMVGACLSIMLLATADYEKNGVVSMLVTAVIGSLVWAQLLVFIVFCVFEQDKLDL